MQFALVEYASIGYFSHKAALLTGEKAGRTVELPFANRRVAKKADVSVVLGAAIECNLVKEKTSNNLVSKGSIVVITRVERRVARQVAVEWLPLAELESLVHKK